MISPKFKSELLGQQKKLRKIWFAFGDSVLVFLGIPHLLPSLFDGEYQYAEIVRVGLWVVAIGEIALSAWWRNNYLSKESIFREAATNTRLKLLPGIPQPQSPLEEGAAKVVSWFWTVKLIAFATAVSLAVYGFILAFLGGYFTDQYVLSFISGLLLVHEFPSAEAFESLLKEYEAREGVQKEH